MAKKTPTIKISTVLLCDDARREDTGKDILIGVYCGDVIVGELPTNIIVCLWLLIETRTSGKVDKEIRIINPVDQPILSGKLSATINTDEKGYASFMLPRLLLAIEKEGIIKFQWRSPKGRWSTILTKNVRLSRETDTFKP